MGNLEYYCSGGGDNMYLNTSVASIPSGFNDDGGQGVLFIKNQADLYIMGSGRTGGSGYSFLISDSIESPFIRFPFLGGEKQQAINHQNGRDIWYANHAQNGDSVYFFLIHKQGLLECPIVTHTTNEYYGGAMGWSSQGQMKFSSNGEYLAEVSYVDPFSVGLYTFNTEYPVTEKIFLHSKAFVPPYTKRWFSGLVFSPYNSRLYVNSGIKTHKYLTIYLVEAFYILIVSTTVATSSVPFGLVCGFVRWECVKSHNLALYQNLRCLH
jgi:hypothetical protein